MIISAFTYNGEKDILDIHLNVLKDHVDQFIICEAPITFSGKPKPLYFKEVEHLYTDFPIKYYVIDENDPELWEMARNSPNTQGAEHWKREFVQKESIKKALTHLKDDDIVFIGDCDEVWDTDIIADGKVYLQLPSKLKLKVFTYYLNNHSTEEFWGTFVSDYKTIREGCLNHLRSDTKYRIEGTAGWHFTSMGGFDEFKRKLGDSYTEESYFTPQIQAELVTRYGNSDFLGRGFGFYKSEDLPSYILENKEKFNHLWKQ
jgi:beta-1,4-mannosyl-glycoprotein beta-1,4-N-acetylglucosaminyltransferase